MFTLKNSLPYLIVFLLIFSVGCKKNSTTEVVLLGDFKPRSSLNGAARSNAAGFSIGNKGYITTGVTTLKKLNDLWEYDADLMSWQQKAAFPGKARYDAASFSIGNNGYVGTGWDGNEFYTDFYRYNSLDNKWDSIAPFPIGGRQGSVSFGVGNFGFVGTGNDGNSTVKDFWKYDPTAGTWTEIPSLIDKRADGLAFTIGDKAYVGMGMNNGLYLNDFFEFDPATNTWTPLTDAYPAQDSDKNGQWDRDVRRTGAAAFSVDGKGYVVTGNYSGYAQSTWEYNPSNHFWTQKSNFEGAGRTDAVGLTIGNKGFVVTGKNGASKWDDMWEFIPNATQELQ